MMVANMGYVDKTLNSSQKERKTMCLKHFYPSFFNRDHNDNFVLKVGTSPTMNLTEFSMSNENFKEDKKLPRTVGNVEDL